MPLRRRHLLLTMAGGFAAPRLAHAAWPERPIQVICPGPAGGGMDAYARAIIPFVAPRLNNANMVVINRPNASGQLAFESVAIAEPDGYTIGVAQTPNLITLPIERQVRYRVQDLTYLANVVEDPGGIFVRADSPLRSLKDLLEAARARPESVAIGSAGIGTDDHLLILALQEATGTRFAHVPYSGTPPIIQGVLAKDIAAGSLNVSEGIALVRQGALRLLGQGGPARWQEAADVPTFREQGIDMVAGSVRGVIGPPGMSAELRDRFRTAFAEALADPAWVREAARLSLPLRVMSGEEQQRLFLADDVKLRALWQRQPWRE
ncbi:Bug family tripartite tricarboxylate transporter substrate binding protein [Teichococcus oryzae]|uniref:Tripartite tricarboxylate transporter substrate binding protein n=1 Tax=Teichococcus oryzae TaxID=1608942 RepID=A0A5B2TD71_9PROT|nr:tripartite tricarboxylate transporter substrate binding protein [Pseudoroseomonas oryzae]KAA2212015.1 tripartite tricarboxylate transporter substrate binding protein [Pseudoroseomonas oryzae]